ncbi:unnamed protein product, partial [Amoebophrya sp. A25]
WPGDSNNVQNNASGAFGGSAVGDHDADRQRVFQVTFSQSSLIRTHQFHNETRITHAVTTKKEDTQWHIFLQYGNLDELRNVLQQLSGTATGRGQVSRVEGASAAASGALQQQKLVASLYKDVAFDISRLDHRERQQLLLPTRGVW